MLEPHEFKTARQLSKKRILMLCASNGKTIGGMESQVIALTHSLSKQGEFKIALAASSALCGLAPKKKACYPLPLQLSRGNPILLFQLFEVIRKFQPDLIHCHGQKAAQLLARLRFISPHCVRVVTVHGDKRRNKELRHFDTIISVSKHLRRKLSRQGLETELIENGVNPFKGKATHKYALCTKHGLNPELPLLISVARLAQVKNLDMLIKACARLPANLVIFGDGPERDNLHKLAHCNTVLAGYDNDVQAHYAAADALVIPSHREGMSLSMIEALLEKTLVLSSPVAGALDLLPKTCILDIASASALEKDLRKKLPHLPKLTKDSHSAFDYAQQHLTHEKMSQNTHAVYVDQLRKRSK